MPALSIGDTDFLLDGAPHRILSGAIHYFRVHPDQWADRIAKARQMGLNTIETYVAWNYHAPVRGEFRTEGQYDLGRFLDLIAAEGMQAIVRPGPYICAEWTNGGLPAWLTTDPSVTLRRDEPNYMTAVEQYLRQLEPILRPRMSGNGGPIVLMQVENEYGAYGSDKDYLARLVELYGELGFDVPLTTVDQPLDRMLEDGTLPGLLSTGSFGSRIDERLDTLRAHQPTGPLMCSEFWIGWFDSWGLHHHTTSVQDAADALDRLLARGASVNIYMFHGGTNFGFTGGANDKGVYQPIATSYDYDAPLAEDGTPTEKYWAFREVISRYANVPDDVPASRVSAPVIDTAFDSALDWRLALEHTLDWQDSAAPSTFEQLGAEGFAAYRSTLNGDSALDFPDVRDRAQFFVDDRPVGALNRDAGDRVLALGSASTGRLDVLVEELGRVDYEIRLGEWKGLGPVDGSAAPWQSAAVDFDVPLLTDRTRDRGLAVDGSGAIAGPAFLTARFEVDASRDLFLSTERWGKGVVWINGFSLGRYWSRGPQHTLYVPGPVVRPGGNEVLVFEVNGMADPRIRFVAEPDLGHTQF